jgi:hypothetical protein
MAWVSSGMAWLTFSKGAEAANNPGRPGMARALSKDECITLDALTARIIPSDDSLGAREAGCVDFIQQTILQGPGAAAMLPLYHGGLAALNTASKAQFQAVFPSLNTEKHDLILALLYPG